MCVCVCVQGGLLIDGFNSCVAALATSMPTTTYAQATPPPPTHPPRPRTHAPTQTLWTVPMAQAAKRAAERVPREGLLACWWSPTSFFLVAPLLFLFSSFLSFVCMAI